jgi:hypothetical protein
VTVVVVLALLALIALLGFVWLLREPSRVELPPPVVRPALRAKRSILEGQLVTADDVEPMADFLARERTRLAKLDRGVRKAIPATRRADLTPIPVTTCVVPVVLDCSYSYASDPGGGCGGGGSSSSGCE